MTYETSRAEELLLLLRGADPPTEPPSRAAGRRRRVVARLEELSLERATSRRLSRRWRIWGALALAATVVLSIGVGWVVRDRVEAGPTSQAAAATVVSVTGTVNLLREGRSRALASSDQARLGTYDVVEATARSGARLLSRRGTVIELSSLTSVRFVVGPEEPAGAERIELFAGRVDVEVPEGVATESFSVRTPTALVLVHGTLFSVELRPGPDAGRDVTLVRVTRGRVLVQHDGAKIRVEAGGSWSSAPAQQQSSAWSGHQASEDFPRDTSRGEQTSTSRTPSPRLAAVPSSRTTTLAEVNRLYGAAMAAKRAGRDRQALRHLDDLLRRFPDASLAAAARVERFRALSRLGRHQEAAGSARRYLDDHPDGFASEEARDVVSGSQRSSVAGKPE
jgi:hypothetical protein